MIMGDIGAKILLHYIGLERQWLIRYQLSKQIEKKITN